MAIAGISQSTAAACSPDGVASTGKNNTQRAYNFLVAKPELNSVQAAAIVGNLIHENGNDPLVPNQYNTAGSGAFGIAQWLGVRLENLKRFNYNNEDWQTSIDLQLNFLWQELKGSENASLQAIRKINDIDLATTTFERMFERSGDVGSYPRRIANARRALQDYGDKAGTADSVGLDTECLVGGLGSGDLDGEVKIDSSPGKLVPVPGFPGERIDSRVLPNLMALVRKYKLHVGDCHVTPAELGPHAANGEHPLGVGCDLHPDPTKGGTWEMVDALAKWAEPSQNNPIPPFRWVGYDGDANHGKYNHIHLSWDHAPAAPFTVPAWVKVIG